jgi:type II secretory pathway component PulF
VGWERVRSDLRRLLSTPGERRRALLYEELASLLQAGIGMRGAVASLADRGAGRAAGMLRVWSEQVERGDPLHEGMALHPECFTDLETTMIRIGERSGRLEDSLRKLAARLEAAHRARLSVLASVAYPVIVIHVALVLPTLPLVLVPLGFGAYATLVMTGLALIWGVPALLAAIYAARRTDPAFSRRVCKLPLVGAAVHAGAVQRFAWTLGALHDAGESADVSLEEAAEAADCGWFRSRLQGALGSIRDGGSMNDAVRWLEAVPRDVCEMMGTGELSGTIAETMERAAALYQERGERAVRAAARAAGAVLFVIAVLVVVIAVFSVFARVYGPVFEMTR